jgi:hypothetical protein
MRRKGFGTSVGSMVRVGVEGTQDDNNCQETVVVRNVECAHIPVSEEVTQKRGRPEVKWEGRGMSNLKCGPLLCMA